MSLLFQDLSIVIQTDTLAPVLSENMDVLFILVNKTSSDSVTPIFTEVTDSVAITVNKSDSIGPVLVQEVAWPTTIETIKTDSLAPAFIETLQSSTITTRSEALTVGLAEESELFRFLPPSQRRHHRGMVTNSADVPLGQVIG